MRVARGNKGMARGRMRVARGNKREAGDSKRVAVGAMKVTGGRRQKGEQEARREWREAE
jgi:hypothetical protein